jgi:hypothetical protein
VSTIVHGVDIDAVLNQPPAQRYSGPEAIAQRDEMLLDRALCRVRSQVPAVPGPVREVELTEKDLGT